MTTKLYRVQDDLGRGMYHYTSCPEVRWQMTEQKYHPSPEEDVGLCDKWQELRKDCRSHREYQFAFSSLDQLRMWIYRQSWRENLAHAGFYISVLSCEDYYLGETQAVYRPETATEIEALQLLEI